MVLIFNLYDKVLFGDLNVYFVVNFKVCSF